MSSHPVRLLRTLAVTGALVCVLAAAAGTAGAQQPATGFDDSKQWKIEQLGENHWRLTGAVEASHGDMKFFADQVESWTDTHRVVATGNVVFVQGGSRISADRADFNTETRMGTFFNATGTAVIAGKPKKDALGGQEPDIYFYGDQVEKIGVERYRIRHGGFTTCLQPTPRWELTSGSVTLKLDHYAFLTNAVLRAKSVPVFYLPVLYYPINKEDRATGFLMPTYGSSNYRGFTLSNGFFWAVDRSQDVTLLHDWFSKTGQGAGAEYRYLFSPTSQGSFRVYRLAERAYTSTFGVEQPASTSYEVRGNASYGLGHGWTARSRVDYFTSVRTQQLYHTNIYDASSSQRSYSVALSGSALGVGVNTAFDRSEFFTGEQNSALTGSAPRINLNRGERPLFGSPVYFSASGEYVALQRQSRSSGTVTDYGLARFDFAPVVRVPFTKLRWLTVNSSITWRDTYWTRSNDLTTGAIVDQALSRRYFDLQSRITGPVFNRVFNTPSSGYAEKWKHSIEPFVTLERITAIDVFDRVVKLEGLDYTIGNVTRYDYGVNNRLLVKRKGGGPGGGSSREILNVGVTQTYYTDPRASQYDYSYATSFSGRPPSNFSPIRVSVTASPTDRINGALRLEYDRQQRLLQSLSANGQVAVSDWLNVNGGYSQRKYVNPLLPFSRDNFINATATFRSPTNRIGGLYTFNYDIGHATLINSRIMGFYNAQCCGFSIEYQTYNFPSFTGIPIQKDNRFNFSFTLAGLGTFSNFFGALGGGGMR